MNSPNFWGWVMEMTTIIPIVVVVLGWLIVHQLSISRDIKNKRNELITRYLIEAYRKLENVSHRNNPSLQDFESAIADIQLFGTKQQVELAQAVALKFAKDNSVSLDDILTDLREDLRRLLHLETIPRKPPIILRCNVHD